MKYKNILLLVMVLGLAVSCDSSGKLETANTPGSDKTMVSILNDDDCFDERMEKWFIEFNQLQNEGFDMNEANTKAIASVDLEFRMCNGKPADRTAIHEESTE